MAIIRPGVPASNRSSSSLFGRLFSDHPRSIGESYGEHAVTAARFGLRMVAGGVRCLVHAVIPGIHERAASDCVRELHGQLEKRRREMDVDPDYVI